jgi:hypothetical protein
VHTDIGSGRAKGLVVVLIEGLVELLAQAIVRLFKVVSDGLATVAGAEVRFLFVVGQVGEVVVQRKGHPCWPRRGEQVLSVQANRRNFNTDWGS